PSEKSAAVAIADEAWKNVEAQRKRKDPNYQPQPKPKKFNGSILLTTVGRCIFNDVLPPKMPFYNYALPSAGGSRVIADCYAQLGRPATIALLDDMKMLGFRRSTLAGLSFGVTDIRSPDSKATILEEGQKRADKIEKNYRMGAIT